MMDRDAVLETDRLRLEPLRASHATEMFALLQDPGLYRFIPRDPPPTLESLVARFARLETRTSPAGDEVWLNWIVRSRAENTCLGRVEVTLRQDASAYFAYEIAPPCWRQGFATEACRRILKALFEDEGLAKVVAEVDTRNVASIRLLERLGFERVGFRKDADFFKSSASDEYTYACVQPAGGQTDRQSGAR